MPDLIRHERCETCKYFAKGAPNSECRRYPPHLFGAPTGANAGGLVWSYNIAFPMVLAEFWCGEWRTKIMVSGGGMQ